MANPLDILIVRTSKAKKSQPATFTWAEVTNTSPLAIRFDVMTEDLDGIPSTLVPLANGDRVFVVIADRRATIIGKAQ